LRFKEINYLKYNYYHSEMATNMMASMKNTVAANLLIEDHLTKAMAKGGTLKFNDPKKSKLVPRQKHSCFGDFPGDHMKP
jgi:hypothetical protein